jgi:hypothetical protein
MIADFFPIIVYFLTIDKEHFQELLNCKIVGIIEYLAENWDANKLKVNYNRY